MHTRYLSLPYRQNSVDYFLALRDLPQPVLLQSSPLSAGRYDILSANPVEQISLAKGQSQPESFLKQRTIDALHRHTTTKPEAHNALPDKLPRDIPFIAGAIGLLDYHLGEKIHDVESQANNSDANTSFIGIYQWALIQDHQSQQAWLIADIKLDSTQWNALCKRFEKIRPLDNNRFELIGDWQTSLAKHEYRHCFDKLLNYIHAGDCYQVNLTRRFSAQYKGDPLTAYCALSSKTAAPYGAYFETIKAAVASFSPERFIHIHNGAVLTQPIKGTRPRSPLAADDAQTIAELSGSAKDRAENLMIVDLMRNDLGKHCANGSISVPKLFEIESYTNVHHMVSSVTGTIAANDIEASLGVLLSCMPGGSITGAPKKRAMEIIAELEPKSRSIYCGSAFYLNRNGNLDSNILIRSLLFNKHTTNDIENVYCWGGGGIVADSIPENELQESYYKISNLLETLNTFRQDTPATLNN